MINEIERRGGATMRVDEAVRLLDNYELEYGPRTRSGIKALLLQLQAEGAAMRTALLYVQDIARDLPDGCGLDISIINDTLGIATAGASLLARLQRAENSNKKHYGKRCGNCLNRLSGYCSVMGRTMHPAGSCPRWEGGPCQQK